MRCFDALKDCQCRARKHIERNETGYWIAGQAKDQLVAGRCKIQWFAWLHEDTPEVDLGEIADQGFHEVTIPHRHSAAGDDNVGYLQCFCKGCSERIFIIRNMPVDHDGSTSLPHCKRECESVRISDLTWPWCDPRSNHFIAG